jgi:hypothetical protein
MIRLAAGNAALMGVARCSVDAVGGSVQNISIPGKPFRPSRVGRRRWRWGDTSANQLYPRLARRLQEEGIGSIRVPIETQWI